MMENGSQRVYHKFVLLFGAFIFMTAQPADASQTMAHDTCDLVGTITSIEEVTIKRTQPQSWLDDWGLTNSHQETAVQISPLTINAAKDVPYDKDSCTLEKARGGYYLRNRDYTKTFLNDYKIGDCIQASTNFSGDEFRIGNWVYDLTKLPDSACSKAETKEIKTESETK